MAKDSAHSRFTASVFWRWLVFRGMYVIYVWSCSSIFTTLAFVTFGFINSFQCCFYVQDEPNWTSQHLYSQAIIELYNCKFASFLKKLDFWKKNIEAHAYIFTSIHIYIVFPFFFFFFLFQTLTITKRMKRIYNTRTHTKCVTKMPHVCVAA